MKEEMRRKLRESGFRVGTAEEFLGLSEEEASFLQMKLALATELRATRRRKRLTQVELAEALGSSQSRVAKMEGGDSSVSLDLLIRSLLTMGVSRQEVAKVIGHRD